MNWNRWTIRWKLTLWNAAVLTLLFCAFSAAMLFAVHAHLTDQVDKFFMEELQELIEDMRRIDDPKALSSQLDQRYAVHENYHFQVLDENGQPLFRSRYLTRVKLPYPGPPAQMRGHRYENIDLPEGNFRLLTMPFRDSHSVPLLLQVVTPRAAMRQEFRWYQGTLLASLPIAIFVSIVTGNLLARQALRPLEQMSDTARRISAEDLHQRITVENVNDELGQLATTLNAAFERLRVSITQMKQFTSDAAHELRSPIAALKARAEVTLRAMRTSDEYERVVQETLDETNHMSELVDQLLLLSRHDSGQQTAQFEEMRVDVLLLDVIDRFRPLAETHGLRIEQSVFPPWGLNGDDIWLSMLFWNLLENAAKYTPRGGEIRVSAQVVGHRWHCSVQDTGAGIEERHLPRIFDRFYRVDASRTRSAGGTGLGLAICQSIAEAHGGQITVTSEVGVGSRFLVVLPGHPVVIDRDFDESESGESESPVAKEAEPA